LPIIPEGIPVLGADAKMGVPFLLVIGLEIEWGGANAIPGAKMFG
jgi:hypothetical protein